MTEVTFRNAFLGLDGSSSWSFLPENRQNMTCQFSGGSTICSFVSDIFASSLLLAPSEIISVPNIQLDSRKSGAGRVHFSGTSGPGGDFPIFAWASVDGHELPVLTDLDAGWADSCPYPCFPLSFRTDLVVSGLRWFGGWYARAHIGNPDVRDLVYTLEVVDDQGTVIATREVLVFAESMTTVDLSELDPGARSLRQIRLIVHGKSGSAGERALMVVETGPVARPEARRFLRPQLVLPGGLPAAEGFRIDVAFFGVAQGQPVTWYIRPSADTVKAVLGVTDEELTALQGIRFYECALHEDALVNSIPEIFERWSHLDAQTQQDFVGDLSQARPFLYAYGNPAVVSPCGSDPDGKVLMAMSITVYPRLVQGDGAARGGR